MHIKQFWPIGFTPELFQHDFIRKYIYMLIFNLSFLNIKSSKMHTVKK